ncbi:MAG TPA: ABC transporter substrate-binding protein [Mycobacteriales bacterium]|nr:ABC transporter substrate-binding protein [Mycobacteriales bacterium]
MVTTSSSPHRSGRRFRWRLSALLVVLLAGFTTLAACTGGSSASLGADAGAGGGGADSASIASTAFRWWNAPWGSSVPLNPYTAGYAGDAFGIVRLPLAYVLPAPDKFGTYYPELASSWDVTDSKVTLHLRKEALWEDGSQFTSKDVLTSLLLSGSELNQVWSLLSSVTTPDPKTVVLNIAKGSSAELALDNVMTTSILPDSQYGKLVPPNLQQDLVTYWKTYDPAHATNKSIAAASATPAYKTISKAGAALIDFKPKNLMANGPFRLIKVTNSEILMKKWDKFWDADKITAPWAVVSAMNDSTAIGAYLTGKMDFDDSTQLTTPILKSRVENSDSLHYNVVHTNVQQQGLLFNYDHYPYNIREVRQALAHVIDRKKLVALDVGGSPAQNVAVAHPEGIHEVIAAQYLSKDQLNSLDPYDLDPGKAADLLESAGFTKDGGKWHTPKGDVFKVNIFTLAGYSMFETDANVVANNLKQFGIDASTTSVPNPAFAQRQNTGQYGVSIAWLDTGTNNPLSYFNYSLHSPYNYPATWNGEGKCTNNGSPCQPAIGVGPIDEVPGLGKVNLAQTINYQLLTVPPGPKWKELTWDWARYINKELPILPLQNNAIHEAYSTSRYTNWPADDSKLWTLYGSRQILYFMQNGYLKLKK